MAKKKTIPAEVPVPGIQDNSFPKEKHLDFRVKLKCKNAKQKEFLNQLRNDNKKICFGLGSPGTGKSFVSLGYALEAIKEGRYDNIVMIIPTAQAGGADFSIGFLKGDFNEKTYMFTESDKQTITKILKISGNSSENEITNKLVSSGVIKYEYVNFLLGKTFDRSIILVNEAEEYTKDNMRLILTRMGEDSKIVITGDIKQVNRRSIKNKNDEAGLPYASSVLKELEETSITTFEDSDIVRNGLITKILEKYDN